MCREKKKREKERERERKRERELLMLPNVGHKIVHGKLLALLGAHFILYVSRLRVNIRLKIYAKIFRPFQVITVHADGQECKVRIFLEVHVYLQCINYCMC